MLRVVVKQLHRIADDLRLIDKPAVTQEDHPVGPRRVPRLVRDQHPGRARVAAVAEQAQDLLAGVGLDHADDRGVEHAFVDLGRDGHLDYRLPGELTERVPVIGLAQLLERIRPGRDAASDPTRVELALGTISFGTAVLRQLGVQVRRLWSLETPRG